MMANLGLKTPDCDYSSSHSSNYNIQVSTRTRNNASNDSSQMQCRHHFRPGATLYLDKRYFKVNHCVLGLH